MSTTDRVNAIDTIRQSVDALDPPSCVLGRAILDNHEVDAALAVVEVNRGTYTVVCRDVPVWAVVALSHNNHLEPGDTWGDATTKRLTDFWPLESLDYLESPLFMAFLHQGSAQEYLELRSVGGAVVCSNGNHRLPAAMAWLVATAQDDNAVLNLVHLSVAHQVDEQAIKLMLGLWRKGWRLSYRQDGYGDYYIKAAGGFRVERVYKRKRMKPGFMHEKWLHPVLNMVSKFEAPRGFYTDAEVWRPFPECILEAWDRRGEWDGWRAEGEAVSLDVLADRVIAQKQADALRWCRTRAADHFQHGREKQGKVWDSVADVIKSKVA